MSDLKFKLEIKAEGEVRDAEGNLVRPMTFAGVHEVTREQAEALGLEVPPHPDEEK